MDVLHLDALVGGKPDYVPHVWNSPHITAKNPYDPYQNLTFGIDVLDGRKHFSSFTVLFVYKKLTTAYPVQKLNMLHAIFLRLFIRYAFFSWGFALNYNNRYTH